jgi:hypothetical protein
MDDDGRAAPPIPASLLLLLLLPASCARADRGRVEKPSAMWPLVEPQKKKAHDFVDRAQAEAAVRLHPIIKLLTASFIWFFLLLPQDSGIFGFTIQ